MAYELRAYTANPGKMDALVTCFHDDTLDLFTEHNMKSLGCQMTAIADDVLV